MAGDEWAYSECINTSKKGITAEGFLRVKENDFNALRAEDNNNDS